MNRNTANAAIGRREIEHNAPAGDHHPIPMKAGNLVIARINATGQLLEFDPATEMYNRK